MLTQYLEKSRILLNFEAIDYKEILKKMLAVIEIKDLSQVIEEITKREALMPTVLGKGVALPRTILNDKVKTEIIIAISTKGIDLNSFDHRPVKIIFLSLFSKKDNYAYILAQSLQLLNDDSFRNELLKAKTKDAVINVIKEWEEE